MQIFPVKRPEMDVEEGDELLVAFIEQYGYRTETSEYPGQVVIIEDAR